MLVFIIIVLFVLLLSLFIQFINFKYVVRCIDNENVAIGGLRGTGKDLLMSNYCAYTKSSKSYICNVDYHIKNKTFIPLNINTLDIKNNYDNFINGNINKYKYPYNDRIPILISDAQLYFPSAYESDLKKKYQGIVNYFPLSRHLGNNNVCVNSQNYKMVWDKLRNQCDKYFLCMSCCVVFKKFVFMRIREYELYDSFIARIPPYRAPFKLGGLSKTNIDLHKISYQASYGSIKKMKLFFITKSKYDSRFMKGVLENGKELL